MSTNRSHLTPTPITDKNGVTSVRWTKPVSGAGAKTTLPAVLAQPNTQQLVREITSRLTQAFAFQNEHSEDNLGVIADSCRAAISTFSPDTLQRIKDSKLTDSRIMHLADELIGGWSEVVTNDYLHLVDVFEAEGIHSKDVGWYLKSIPHYEGVARATYGNYPAERASQINALITVVRYMEDHDIDCYKGLNTGDDWDEVPFVTDEDLQRLLISSDYDRDAVISIIKERDTYDADTIKHLLDNGILTPLGDGVL